MNLKTITQLPVNLILIAALFLLGIPTTSIPCFGQTKAKVNQNERAKAVVSLLKAGPMLAWSEIREVGIWVQTTGPARVQVRYSEIDTAGKGVIGQELSTKELETDPELAYTKTLVADLVSPGKRYRYDLYINGKKVSRPYRTEFISQPLWQYRTAPPTFTVAVGSCTYVNDSVYDRPGKGYGSDYKIFNSLASAKPELMLWIGDNTYLREADWTTRTGILHRFSHTRALAEMQPLLASTHHYATWDDHDYGPNDADRSYPAKKTTSEVFNAFYPGLFRGQAGEGSMTSTFTWGDVQFFLLDDRWHRGPNEEKNGEKDYFGAEQLRWLEDALTFSRAKFKVIASGGQLLNPAAFFENYATYPAEQKKFIELVARSNARGVVMLSGDRHHTVLLKKDREGKYPLYELTTSSLTAGTASPKEEEGALRVPETLVKEHNYALLTFSGVAEERLLTMRICNADGIEVWKREIKASELK
jgi:alkaline phosphatase D